jgi:hypothetical protein
VWTVIGRRDHELIADGLGTVIRFPEWLARLAEGSGAGTGMVGPKARRKKTGVHQFAA